MWYMYHSPLTEVGFFLQENDKKVETTILTWGYVVMNIKRVLISVSDKTGIIEFAKELTDRGIELISTGGTAKLLSDAGIQVKQVSDVTGFPEILGGRVKTLHPKIFGGVLADLEEKSHVQDLQDNQIIPIDMVVVNLYPFDEIEKTTRVEDVLIENIDIGGVSLLRASAKNHRNVVVVCDPADYPKIIKSLDFCGDVTLQDRRMFALKAFYYTMKYDATIHRVLSELFASEKYEHMTFERFGGPQSDYEILDMVDNKFISVSKYTKDVASISLGAVLTFIAPNILVGLRDGLPISMVNIKKSGGRICDLMGDILVVRKLTNDLARKLKESTFTTIAYETIEDEDIIEDILSSKELIKYTYTQEPEKFYVAKLIQNIMVKEYLKTENIKDDQDKDEQAIKFVLRFMPKYAVIVQTEDGFINTEIDFASNVDALQRCIIKSNSKPTKIGTNGPIDPIFTKICKENGIEDIISC
ncbi:MAG TPA: IMP cyclohydrolase [Fervidobacterium sp.]|nr:IMP cyclohydrolase [Fervidobacterium sp.]HPT54589.1 IMP cyclohydrolase [Fervidobacterium sp.]HPZ16785.1 IMP cyclohydrolase [Fervidobacterium sp.]HQE47852.1 IMP cyclohydrolase [Fervidobacterium sp.]HUM44722.1 IMP cyclohydrolase [Fervidobacterium sp.]